MTITTMKLRTQREIALSVARGQLRKLGDKPELQSYDKALLVLDELSHTNPDLVASIWYKNASDAQLKAFQRDWNKWRASWRRMIGIDEYHTKLHAAGTLDPAQVAFIEKLAPLPFHCNACGRSVVEGEGHTCLMPQPNGKICKGTIIQTPLLGIAPEVAADD